MKAMKAMKAMKGSLVKGRGVVSKPFIYGGNTS